MRQITSVHAVCAFASIGGGLFGYDIASMSGVLGTSAYINYFGNPKASMQGLITCSMPFGSIFGTLLTSLIADRFSRKTAIQTACVLWIIGSMFVEVLPDIALQDPINTASTASKPRATGSRCCASAASCPGWASGSPRPSCPCTRPRSRRARFAGA